MLRYPVILTNLENGDIMATFLDVPEAITYGHDLPQALAMAEDALLTAFEFYFDARKPVPKPSKPEPGQQVITLSPMTVAKLAIYHAMLEEDISQVELAGRLDCDPRQVRRLLDLRHNSRLDQLEKALKALGRRLVLEVRKAA
jgi:antitoxin HicB